MSSLEEAIDLVSLEDSTNDPYEDFACYLIGPPKAMGRPRYRKFQGFYNPSKKHLDAYKNMLLERRRELFWEEDVVYPKGVPLFVHIDCEMRRPNKHFKSEGKTGRRWENLKTWAKKLYSHTTTPDVDNIAKLVMDAMTGVIYHDDSQVVHLVVLKAEPLLPPLFQHESA